LRPSGHTASAVTRSVDGVGTVRKRHIRAHENPMRGLAGDYMILLCRRITVALWRLPQPRQGAVSRRCMVGRRIECAERLERRHRLLEDSTTGITASVACGVSHAVLAVRDGKRLPGSARCARRALTDLVVSNAHARRIFNVMFSGVKNLLSVTRKRGILE
jgi:hypothetical protein